MTKSTPASPTAVHVGVHEAKTRLSELLRMVDAGQEVEILRNGEPVAKLVSMHSPKSRRVFGQDRGRLSVPEDFNAPLPDDVLDTFAS
jgi:prevent-host-death family protein